jgi:hypothetical protein
MTKVVKRESRDSDSDIAYVDDYAIVSPRLAPTRGVTRLREAEVHDGVRSELQYVMNMRQLGQMYLASHPSPAVQTLLWRVIASVAVAVAVAACGLTLTALAMIGGSVRPNPYVSLAVLLVGISLCATVATVIRDRRPYARSL